MKAGFIWDDDSLVTGNLQLRSFDGLVRTWTEPRVNNQYYPMTFTSFWIEYQIWGDSPTGYHITNITLHLVTSLLLLLVLRQLRLPGAMWAAALFALHPVHVESVAWISERKNVLSSALYLSALLAYLRFNSLDDEKKPQRRNGWWYALTLLLFSLAVLSKTITCSLPAAIILLLYWKRKKIAAIEMVELAPMFLIGLTLAMTTVMLERDVVGAEGIKWSLSFVDRCLIAGRALCFYPRKLLWPYPLSFNYERWLIDDGVWWQYLYPAIVLVLVAMLWLKRKKWGKGPLVAALLFCGTMLPALGFVNVYPMRYSFVADHFQYLASMALIAAAVAGIAILARRAKAIGVSAAAGLAVLLIYGGLVFYNARHYKDLESLWLSVIRVNPTSWLAHNNLGALYESRGDYARAIEQFDTAISVDPGNYESYSALGHIALRLNQPEKAMDQFRRAIEINPKMMDARMKLVNMLADRGRFDESLNLARGGVEQHPKLHSAHAAVGTVLLRMNRLDDAARSLRIAIDLDPNQGQTHNTLGVVFDRMNRIDDAIRHYVEAVRLQPNLVLAHHNLAVVFAAKGRLSDAIVHFEKTLELKPDHPTAGAELRRVKARLNERRNGG